MTNDQAASCTYDICYACGRLVRSAEAVWVSGSAYHSACARSRLAEFEQAIARERIMAGRKCMACRHWQRTWEGSEEWEFGNRSGLCGALGEMYKHWPDEDQLKRRAWPICRSESTTADLITTPEFGCLLWEESTNAD